MKTIGTYNRNCFSFLNIKISQGTYKKIRLLSSTKRQDYPTEETNAEKQMNDTYAMKQKNGTVK